MIEQSNTRLPDFGHTRGQVIFRYNHQQTQRQTDGGEAETVWKCTHDRLDQKEMSAHRDMLMARLTKEVNNYINSHYDGGSQASFQALYSLPTTPQTVKSAILPLWPWIQSVMQYYYGKKANIRDGADYKDITWDFTRFDATDPNVDLEEFMVPPG